MPRSNEDTQKFIRIIWQDHKTYWKQKAGELKKYKNAYESTFWNQGISMITGLMDELEELKL